MAGGRPSDYDPSYCDVVRELGQQGKLTSQMAAAIGTTKRTLHDWAAAHPEFSHAFNEAREFAEAWHLEKATETAIGDRQGNAGMAKFLLSAAFGYREGSDVTQTQQGPNGGPIKQQTEVLVKLVDSDGNGARGD